MASLKVKNVFGYQAAARGASFRNMRRMEASFKREGVAVEIFPILGEAATTVEPCDGALDDPTLG